MAHFGKDLDDFKGSRCVHIRSAEQTEHFTVYIITVTVGHYSWTVKHRYSEFHDLHEKLTASYKLDKSLLPPKKIFGNQTEAFIKKRQRELEIYLQTIILYLAQHIPSCLAYFLDFDNYEIHGITQAMAEDLYNRGESLLLAREKYEVSTLQLYSLTERLKLPEPTCDSGDVKKDLGHILDFITRAKHLTVKSSKKPVGSSNIMMSKLPFDLTLFKSLQTLEICGCNFRLVNGLETVKQTLVRLEVHESSSSIKEILLQDAPHWRAEDGTVVIGYWDLVTELDFSGNSFAEIHDSIQLIPNVEKLNLSYNVLENLQNLQYLSQLTHLDLSHNNIKHLDSLHTKMGNVKCVRLAHNQLESLHGFAKLFSLQTLDVSHNKISSIEELRYVSQLPCVENLSLVGNAVTSTLDYRTKTLEMFGDRVAEVVLDYKPPDQKELDTVAVLQALRKAKDVKITKKPHPKKNTSAASLSDMCSQSSSGSLSEHGDGKNSRTASPAHGLLSRSVPSNMADWQKRDSGGTNRSSSPYSQESVSSYSSVQEVEEIGGEPIPEAHPYDIGASSDSSATPTDVTNRHSRSIGTYSQKSNNENMYSSNNSNNNNNSSNDNDDNIHTYPHQLVPEAHPFDLTIENPASIDLRNPRTSVDFGQVSQPPHSPKHLSSSHPATMAHSTTRQQTSTTSSSASSLSHDKPTQVPVSGVVAPTSSSSSSSALTPSVPATATPLPPPPHSSQVTSYSLNPDSGPSQKRRLMSIYNAADLPGTSDAGFVLWLSEQLFTSTDTTPTTPTQDCITAGITTPTQDGVTAGTSGAERESVLDILWCYAEQLSEPASLIPCCAVLTKNKIFIEKLIGLESSFPGVPELEPVSIVPLRNIQQVVVGHCHAFLRLEEAFVGKNGTFTLFGVEPQGVKRFVSKIFDTCSELDMDNSPDCVDMSVQSDLLKIIAAREEQNSGMASDRLATAILIRLKNQPKLSFLVLSENRVYCLDIDFVHWPPASFETCPAESMSFIPLHEFSIMDKITDIKIHPSHDEPSDDNPESSPPHPMDQNVNFVQYELSLDVILAESSDTPAAGSAGDVSKTISVSDLSQRHGASVNYMFSSAAYRDLFLDRLTNLRAEQAHRMSPNVREEPEGGNEQQPASDGQRGTAWSRPKTSSSSSVKSLPLKPKTIDSLSGKDIEASSPVKVAQIDSGLYDSPKDKISVSESVKSEKSLGVVSLTESDIYNDNTTQYDTPVGSTTYYSASPRDDLSVSPLSNFSRASISPPVGQDKEKKNIGYQAHITGDTSLAQQITAARADSLSLPSSFDWKQYYIKSPPNINIDSQNAKSQAGVQLRNGKADNFHGTNSCDSYLEDIESSTELESSQVRETDHELYLKQCVKNYDLNLPLPTKLRPLCLMNGRELLKFFHSAVSQQLSQDTQSGLSEELHYVVWSTVVPYSNPKHEIVTLVMLSTHAVYLVSDTAPKVNHKSRPSWMTHTRNQSDSAVAWKSQDSSGGSAGRKMVKPYFVFRFTDLQQVNIGLFDQCVRLTGSNEDSVFTIATRDSVATETFLQKLKHTLSLNVTSPMMERNRKEIEQDFYRNSQRTKSTTEDFVYTHPSQVSFVYPGDDAVKDILYLVNECTHGGGSASSSSGGGASKLWLYLQCYLLPSDDSVMSDRSQARSAIVTPTHFCLAEEDIVTYPLPDFVRGLPENPQHEIVECRRIDSLKRITLYHGHPHWVSLTFLDEPEDIVVDVSMEHFSQAKGSKEKKHVSPEVTYRLFVQSGKEKEKLVQVLNLLWKGLVSQVGRILDINKV